MKDIKLNEGCSELTIAAVNAALLGGDVLKRGYNTQFTIETKKGRHNLVTEVDLAAEKRIITFLQEKFPTHSFLSEEKGEINNGESSIQWVIDPLDGTVNFAHSIPMFSVSIAARMKEEVLCGVIFHPLVHELFIAEKERGAYLNGKRLKVSNTKKLEDAILATGFPYDLEKNPDKCIDRFADVAQRGVPIRRLGVASLDLAYVAAGRFDGYWETNLGLWDFMAGRLLVQEAGGMVSHWDGSHFDLKTNKTILASNSTIHNEMTAILGKI